jgi:hypothetical protein
MSGENSESNNVLKGTCIFLSKLPPGVRLDFSLAKVKGTTKNYLISIREI